MADENKFFRFVWRFNGIVILLVLLGALVGGGFHVAARHGLVHWKWHDAKFIHLARDFHPSQSYALTPLDNGMTAKDSPETLYMLNRFSSGMPAPEFGPLGMAGNSATVNILAVDAKSKTSHWLFKHGDRDILSQTLLFDYEKTKASNDEGPISKPVGVALLVAESDTNKDGKINAKDSLALYFYRLDGKAPEKMLEADRIILAPVTYGADRLELFYQIGDKSFATSYSLSKLERLSDIPISGLPKLTNSEGANSVVSFLTEPSVE